MTGFLSNGGCKTGAFLSFLGLFFGAGFLFAQTWGELAPQERSLSSLPEDSAADAVILFDKQYVHVSGSAHLMIQRHTRIKILTEKGKKQADIKLPFYEGDKLSRLEAQTIQPDGKKVVVSDKEIFEERWQGWRRKVFAFPAVLAGSVIEYRYEIARKDAPLLEPWFFQNDEPTRLSQLTIEVPEKFEYDMAVTRFPGLTPEFSEELTSPFLSSPKKILRWKLENIPAIKPEPYVPYPGDYLTCVRFQLFAGTWGDFGEGFRKWLAPFLKEGSETRKLAAGLAPAGGSDSLRAKALYDYVRSQIETAGSGALFAGRKPVTTEREKKGTAVEKNLLLAGLLRAAGLEAYPVLISTRGNGELHTLWPHPLQFNHLIVACPIGARTFFMDTHDRHCPFGVLPPEDLVKDGLGIHRDWATLIKLKPGIPASGRKAVTETRLDASGDFSCRTRLRFEGYLAVETRRELAEKKEKYFRSRFGKDFAEAVFDSIEILGQDSVDLPVEVSLTYRLPNFVREQEDKAYLSFPWFFRQESNPFVAERRILPVEVAYPFYTEEAITVELPDTYQVLETPGEVRVEHNQAHFSASYRARERGIDARHAFRLEKVLFPPEEYAAIRNLFEQQVSSAQTPVVLKR